MGMGIPFWFMPGDLRILPVTGTGEHDDVCWTSLLFACFFMRLFLRFEDCTEARKRRPGVTEATSLFDLFRHVNESFGLDVRV